MKNDPSKNCLLQRKDQRLRDPSPPRTESEREHQAPRRVLYTYARAHLLISLLVSNRLSYRLS